KEEPPQDSDFHQLIKECSTEVSEEQKQSMEDTMLELVKICQEKEFLCIHDNIDDLIEKQPAERGNHSIQSLQNFRVIRKSSILLNTSQVYSIHAIAPILSTKEPEYSSSMGECEVTLEDKKECDVPISENSPVCDNHSEIFFDSKIGDEISVYDNDFEDIEYDEASTPDCVLNSFESDNSLSDNFLPEIENFCDHTEETRSGNTTHADNSLPEYDSFCFEIEPDQERLINLVKNDISDDSSNDPLLEKSRFIPCLR
nr:hypothetical protein [Tanacetum cinerariifolium]